MGRSVVAVSAIPKHAAERQVRRADTIRLLGDLRVEERQLALPDFEVYGRLRFTRLLILDEPEGDQPVGQCLLADLKLARQRLESLVLVIPKIERRFVERFPDPECGHEKRCRKRIGFPLFSLGART